MNILRSLTDLPFGTAPLHAPCLVPWLFSVSRVLHPIRPLWSPFASTVISSFAHRRWSKNLPRWQKHDTVLTCFRHFRYGYGSIPIDTIFSGMNIHLPTTYFDVHQGYKVLTHCHMNNKKKQLYENKHEVPKSSHFIQNVPKISPEL